MGHQYSDNKIMDMVLTYGVVNANSELPTHLYAQPVPNKNVSLHYCGNSIFKKKHCAFAKISHPIKLSHPVL